MLEPRGHAGMHGAMLTEPVTDDAHAGILCMHAGGFPPVSYEGIIGAVTVALENGLIRGVDGELRIQTPVGLFKAKPELVAVDAGNTPATRVRGVTVTGVPSFVHTAGLSVRIGSRSINVDIAFGGEFYAIVDSESAGVPIEMANASALVRLGREIAGTVEASVQVRHPLHDKRDALQGVIFTATPRTQGDLRSATVLGGDVIRRSPGGSGTAAMMAVLDAMGLLTDDHGFTHEGILGTTLRGSAIGRGLAGDVPTLVPVIEGSASITGFHEFVNL
jgi:proline racemase